MLYYIIRIAIRPGCCLIDFLTGPFVFGGETESSDFANLVYIVRGPEVTKTGRRRVVSATWVVI